jgi:hypothetical protein
MLRTSTRAKVETAMARPAAMRESFMGSSCVLVGFE